MAEKIHGDKPLQNAVLVGTPAKVVKVGITWLRNMVYDEAPDREAEYPDAYAESWFNRACLMMRLGRFAEACESCDRALNLKPDYAYAMKVKGDALMTSVEPKGDTDAAEAGENDDIQTEALELYASALEVLPDYEDARQARAKLLVVRGGCL